MRSRKILSVLATALALFAVVAGILIFGIGAQGTNEIYVVDGVGEGEKTFATVHDALLAAAEAAPQWESDTTLTIKLTADQTVDSADNDILFDVSTIFTSDNKKLPITITSDKTDGTNAVLLLKVEGTTTHSSKSYPQEDWHCTNDYTFLNVDIKTDKAGNNTHPDLLFMAGCGNVVFDGVRFGTTEEGKTSVNIFFAADNNSVTYSKANAKLYDTWTEDCIQAEKDRYKTESGGLLRSSLTFKNTTYNHMPASNSKCPWLVVRRSPGITYTGKDGAKIAPAETEARVIVDEGADLGRIAGFSSTSKVYNIKGKIVIEVKGGKVKGLAADPACYYSSKPSGYSKHAVVDVILKGGEVNTYGLSKSIFAVTGGAHSDYDATSKVNIYVEDGAVINGNICGIGGLGANAKAETHILSPKGTVNIHLNGGTVNGAVYGIAPDTIGHNVSGDININFNGSSVTGEIYGTNNVGTVSGDILITFNSGFTGTASAMNAGTLAEGGTAGILVKSGTVNGTVSAICGTATVKSGAEAYLKTQGGTVKKTFLITLGDTFSVEEGGKVSAYVHGGTLNSSRIGNPTARGTLFSSVAADSYTDIDSAYTVDGVLTYPDNLKKGSTVYIEIGQAKKYSPNTIFAPVQGGMIGGNLHIKYLPGVDLAGTGITTARTVYGAVVLGDYTLEVNSEGGETVDATDIYFQGEWNGKVLGNAYVTAKNLTCKDFYSVAGRNSTISLDNVTASGQIGFTRASYNTKFDLVGEERISRIDSITGTYNNCTAEDMYAVGFNTSAYKMRATIVNNYTNCTVNGNMFCAGYRYVNGGQTYASSILGTITTNFLGGNTVGGRLFGGSSSTSSSSCTSEIINETGNIIINFNAPASNPDTFHDFCAGNGVIGASVPADKAYLDGSVESLTVTVGPNTTFTGEVFVGNRGGTFIPNTNFVINGGTFENTVAGYGITVHSGKFETTFSGEAHRINGGTFHGVIHGTSITLTGGTFMNTVYAEGLVLADGAFLTLKENGGILADEIRGAVTVHKADPWGAFDNVYVEAPAEYAGLITVTDAEDHHDPVILSDRYEVRGWYPALYARIVLKERLYLKLSMDDATVYDFKTEVGEIHPTIAYNGQNIDLSTEDLLGDGYLIRAAGADRLRLPMTYAFNGESITTTSIYELASLGAELYSDTKEIANFFHAVTQYSNAAEDNEVSFTSDDLVAVQRYGNNKANIDPDKMSVSREDGCSIDFTTISLIMGDTIGFRLRVSDATRASLAGARVYFDNISPENRLTEGRHFAINEDSIDLFINAANFETVFKLIVCDEDGKVCLDMSYSVSYVLYEMVKMDVDGLDGSAKKTLDNPKIQATSLLVLYINQYRTYLDSIIPNDQKPTEQTPEEEENLRILAVGNSHSMDTVWLLQEVFRQERPDMKVTVANCYFSGAMTEHMQNINSDSAVYVYYYNDNGSWKTTKEVTVEYALLHQRWDIIIINESSRHIGLEGKASNPNLTPAMIQYIEDTLPYQTQIHYNWTWSAPTDEAFYSPDWIVQPPDTFRDNYTKDYDFNRETHYNKMQAMVEKYIETNDKFDMIHYCATPIQYATEILGIPQTTVYRDYTHLNSYGRLYVAYYLYAQIMEIEKLESITIDLIPVALHYQRTSPGHDIVLTEQMQQDLITCVNYTLKNPKGMPQ